VRVDAREWLCELLEEDGNESRFPTPELMTSEIERLQMTVSIVILRQRAEE